MWRRFKRWRDSRQKVDLYIRDAEGNELNLSGYTVKETLSIHRTWRELINRANQS